MISRSKGYDGYTMGALFSYYKIGHNESLLWLLHTISRHTNEFV